MANNQIEVLMKERKERGLTIVELAQIAGLTQADIVRIERGDQTHTGPDTGPKGLY